MTNNLDEINKILQQVTQRESQPEDEDLYIWFISDREIDSVKVQVEKDKKLKQELGLDEDTAIGTADTLTSEDLMKAAGLSRGNIEEAKETIEAETSMYDTDLDNVEIKIPTPLGTVGTHYVHPDIANLIKALREQLDAPSKESTRKQELANALVTLTQHPNITVVINGGE